MARKKQTQRKKIKKSIPKGEVHIFATFNNTIITITDTNGNTVTWASGGTVGFKGSRKNTPYAARIASGNAAKIAMDNGMKEVSVIVKGPGPGREAAIRGVQGAGLKVTAIRDITPVPHNGCRPPKKRRV